jgi:hypothetical protein
MCVQDKRQVCKTREKHIFARNMETKMQAYYTEDDIKWI